jgi:hexosaminidase
LEEHSTRAGKSIKSFEDMMKKLKFAVIVLCFYIATASSYAATSSPLFSRGYTVIPAPQKVSLGAKDFQFTRAWRVELGAGIKPDDIAVQSLKQELQERFQITLGGSGSSAAVRLAVAPNAVKIGRAEDANKAALAEQAYRLELASDRVTITGNTATGVFYGVQTLVQLLKPGNGTLLLPEGQIEDWPDLQLRIIYWDDAHHLEHLDVLKAALRQASFYKINGFSIKLEGHFQYQHAPAIVEPYALTPVELQELTDYGLKYHIELIPYLDGPAHDAFILKHAEYAKLREYPDNNYEFCATNPETYQLFEGMFEDLLAANKGGKYFVLSTDEPYYLGLANNDQCHEAERAKQLGSVGKVFTEFVTKTAGYLHDHGRTVIFWGEYPLKPDDISALPSYLVNGEMYGPQFDPVFRAHGIKQMVYTWTEGEEQLFPQYYMLPSAERLHPVETGPGRVQEMWEHASFTSLDSLSSTRPDFAQANEADVIGEFVAGWGDPGLHPETFWLGYATGPAVAWHRAAPSPKELEGSFYQLFYGRGTSNMGRLYQLMSEQAQFWTDSWETGPSAARSPIWGNSYGPFHPPRPAHDQYLPLLPVPAPGLLHMGHDWRLENQKRLDLAGRFLAQNDQLLDLLHTNIARTEFNRYNLEVYLSIADLYRQNLIMIQDLGRISDALKAAESAAGKAEAEHALASLDRAIDISENIRQHRNQALQNATATWYQSWFPRVKEANGRQYLDQVDDVKDHEPVRTVDMSYLVYRELLYPMGDWAKQVIAARNEYANAHKLPVRNLSFDWKETSKTVTAARTADESTD